MVWGEILKRLDVSIAIVEVGGDHLAQFAGSMEGGIVIGLDKRDSCCSVC